MKNIYILRRPHFHWLTLFLLTILAPDPTLADDELKFPLLAETVSLETGRGVRLGPPEASSFKYELKPLVCEIADGSEVIAIRQAVIANGEVWFQISPTERTKYNPDQICEKNQPLWMVAKLKTGWTVNILRQNIDIPDRASTSISASPLDPQAKEVETKSSFAIATQYVLLILGTLFALTVITVERNAAFSPRQWDLRLFTFEAFVLILTNFAFCAIIKDKFYVASENSFATTLLSTVEQHVLGYTLLGFILTLLLSKFMSFAKR